MTLTALLVDDEAPARARLRQLLPERADLTIVGEAEDGVQAGERIQALAPDVVFLDIQMPGCSGLEVAASLGQPRPAPHAFLAPGPSSPPKALLARQGADPVNWSLP